MEQSFPTLRTDILLLRHIEDDDIGNIFKGLSHPDVIKYYGVSFHTLEATEEQMAFYRDLERYGTGIWWAICLLDSGEFIGAGGLNNHSKEHRKAEIGLWLYPEYWGMGFMGEAVQAICTYGFEKLDVHRIEGFVESDNLNCKRVLAKSGFIHEGTMVDCEIKNGAFISLELYARLNMNH